MPWGAAIAAAGAVGGALINRDSAKKGAKQTTDLPSWQRPYVQDALGQAQQLYQRGSDSYYPYGTVAPMSRTTLGALSNMAQNNPQMWGNLQNYLTGSLGRTPGAAMVPGEMQAVQGALSGRYADPYGLGGGSANYLQSAMRGGRDISAPQFNASTIRGVGPFGTPMMGRIGQLGSRGISARRMGSPRALQAGGYRAGDTGERGYVGKALAGGFLNRNPYSDQVAGQISRDIQASVGSQFAGGGRSMSGAAARALADQTGEALSQFRGNLYESERDRMQQAAGMASDISGRGDEANRFNIGNQMAAGQFNIGNQMDTDRFNIGNELGAQQFNVGNEMEAGRFNIGNQMAGRQFDIGNLMDTQQQNAANQMAQQTFNANALNNAGQFNIGNQLQAQQFNRGQQSDAASQAMQGYFQGAGNQLQAFGAAGNLGQRFDQANQFGQNYNLQALGMLPELQNARFAGNQQRLAAGGALDQYAQNLLGDQTNRFNFMQQSPWDNLSRYLSSVGGTGWGGSVSGPQPNRTLNMLGGALSGAALGSQVYGAFNQPQTTNPAAGFNPNMNMPNFGSSGGFSFAPSSGGYNFGSF